MDAIDVAMLVVGAFYAIAGLLLARAAVTERMLDVALARLTQKPLPRRDRLSTAFAGLLALVVFTGGVLLMLRLTAATWAFATGTALQALHLVWLAPAILDRDEPPDPNARRRTTNAAILFAAVTVFVLWCAASGRLATWEAATDVARWGTAAAVAVFVVVFGWQARRIRD